MGAVASKFLFVVSFVWIAVVISTTAEFKAVIFADKDTGIPVYSRDSLEAFLSQFSGPFYTYVTVGNARSGKSETGNLRVRMHLGDAAEDQGSFFRVCNELEPCTKGIDVVAVPRADGSGTDLFIDIEGGNLAEATKEMSSFLTIGACMASSALVLVDTVLDDNTLQFVGRIAAHLLDQDSANKGVSCSFREGGPALMIVVNKNDGAVRQEAQPGGLRAIWDGSAAKLNKEAAVINLVFKDIQIFALPYEKDPTQLRSFTTEFGQKVRAVDEQLVAKAKPVTLASEGSATLRYSGTPATIAAALGDIFEQSKTLADKGYAAPRVSDFVSWDASAAVTACGAAFNTAAAAQWATPACEVRCSGEDRGCEVVHEWLSPARDAAQTCFNQATAKWRAGGDPFGASVLDPAHNRLKADTQHRANELHTVWQQANSVDPARTQHESRTREIRRWGPEQCSKRSGAREYIVFGGRKYADFCVSAAYVVEARSCTFKRCGASLGCTDWKETASFEKELSRKQQEV